MKKGTVPYQINDELTIVCPVCQEANRKGRLSEEIIEGSDYDEHLTLTCNNKDCKFY